MEEFEDKVAVVTGGASGIGSGMCRKFASVGMRVVVADIDGESAERFSSELRGSGPSSIVPSKSSPHTQSTAKPSTVCPQASGAAKRIFN